MVSLQTQPPGATIWCSHTSSPWLPQAAVVFREPLKCCDGLSGAPMPLIRPPNPRPAHSNWPIDHHVVPIQPCWMAEGQGLIPHLASRNLSENVAVLSTCGTWFCGNRSKRAGDAVSLQRLTWRREQWWWEGAGFTLKVKVAQSCPTLCDPMDCPWNSPGQNAGVGSLSLLQGIFPTQRLNPGLPHCWRILYQLSHKRRVTKFSSTSGKIPQTDRSVPKLRNAGRRAGPQGCMPPRQVDPPQAGDVGRVSSHPWAASSSWWWRWRHSSRKDTGMWLHSFVQSGAMSLAAKHYCSLRISRGLRAQRFVNVMAPSARQERTWDWNVASTDAAGSVPTRVCQQGLPGGKYLTQTQSHFRQKMWHWRSSSEINSDESEHWWRPSNTLGLEPLNVILFISSIRQIFLEG